MTTSQISFQIISLFISFCVNINEQRMKFSIRKLFSKHLQFSLDLFTFTEGILNGQLHFLCTVFPLYFSVSQYSAANDVKYRNKGQIGKKWNDSSLNIFEFRGQFKVKKKVNIQNIFFADCFKKLFILGWLQLLEMRKMF